MAADSTDKVIRALRNVVGLDGSSLTDAELLARFAENRDPAAFEALVSRHGPLVLGVSRRILGAETEIDDVFQATFLVFARKSSGIRKRESVGSWLHGVARQIARQVQTTMATRRRREVRAKTTEEQVSMNADPIQAASLRELGAVLDEELAALTAAHRAALVACHLEGQSAAAAARQLDVSPSTLKARLKIGTEILRKRLAHRGIDISSLSLAVILAEQNRLRASATLVEATVKAALSFAATGAASVSTHVAALAANALKSMALAKATTGFLAVALIGMIGVLGAAMALPRAADPNPPKVDGPAVIDVAAAQPRTDQHGDPLPDGAIARLGTTRWRHDRTVGFAAFRPDGKSVVSVGDDMTIRIWEYPSGKEIRRIDLANPKPRPLSADFRESYFASAAMTPDGKTIATCMTRPEIRFLDLETGQELSVVKVENRQCMSMAFSGNGQRLAAVDNAGTVFVWNWAEGKLLNKFAGKGDAGTSPRFIAFSPDAKFVATPDFNSSRKTARPRQSLIVWNAETGAEIGEVEPNPNYCFAVFSPDSKTLAYSSFSKAEIVLADAGTGKRFRSITSKDLDSIVASMVFSKDGLKLYGRRRQDYFVTEWDVANGEMLRELGSSRKSRLLQSQPTEDCMSLSPDGKTLVLAGGHNRLTFLDIASGREIISNSGHTRPVVALQFSIDGKRVMAQDLDPSIRQWDALGGVDLGVLDLPDRLLHLAQSPDGKTVVAAVVAQNLGLEFDFRDVVTGKELGKPANATEKRFTSMATCPMTFSGDGKRLALHEPKRPTIDIFEVPSGKQMHALEVDSADAHGHTDPNGRLQNLIASPDGKMLASYANLRFVTIWDLATGKRKGTLTLPHRGPNYVSYECPIPRGAFSPDGRCLAIIRDDGSVLMYELATAQVRRTFGKRSWAPPSSPGYRGENFGTFVNGFPLQEPQYGPHFAFSPNGKHVVHADSDHSVRLWDIAMGVELAAFRGHIAPLTAVAFAPDSKSVASASWDTTSLVWDVSKWTRLALPVKKLEPAELAANWELLDGDDAFKAYDAIVALAKSPMQAVAAIEQLLKPAAPFEPQRMARLIGQLDSGEFKVRDEAYGELLKIGEQALPALDKALAANPPLETRRRLEALREKSLPTSMIQKGDRLRAYRAVEVLDRIGTPEARRLLATYANGAPGALLTTAAEAALKRK